MTADTYTARIGLLKQATGNNNNNWGDKFNSSDLDPLDTLLWGYKYFTGLTGGTLDLSGGTLPPNGPSPLIARTLAFQGALTSQQVVIFPALEGAWTVYNGTTGNQTLILKTSTQTTPIEIPQGTFKEVVCDASNMMRVDRDKVGSLEFKANTVGGSAPGRILCTGQSLLRSDYPYLFSILGTLYGAADGLHFSVPNMTDTGRFVRSTSGSITVGTYQANQLASHTHTYSGTTVSENANHSHFFSASTGAMSANASHTHGWNVTHRAYGSFGNSGSVVTGIQINNGTDGSVELLSTNTDHVHAVSGSTGTESAAHAHTYSGTTDAGGSGSETRPESVAMVATIVF